jgi:hypothetical protein
MEFHSRLLNSNRIYIYPRITSGHTIPHILKEGGQTFLNIYPTAMSTRYQLIHISTRLRINAITILINIKLHFMTQHQETLLVALGAYGGSHGKDPTIRNLWLTYANFYPFWQLHPTSVTLHPYECHNYIGTNTYVILIPDQR